MRIRTVEPTVFFSRDGDALRQLARVGVENDGPEREASLRVRAEGVDAVAPLGLVAPGETTCEAYLPDIREPARVQIELWAGETLEDERTILWRPQKHWEVHLIQYAHHDLGYTDLPSSVWAEYDGFMDQVLAYCQETEHWPEVDARFHYQCEQAWSVVHYVENRPQERIHRLVHYIQNGQIEVTALYGNQTLELCSTEELVRLLYPAFGLKREHGIAISSAEHNDIPGFPWGLASALAGAGVRYFSPGVPLWYFGRDEERVHPLWDTEEALPLDVPAACWWEGPDGARVLLWSDLHGQEWQPYHYDQAFNELPGMLAHLDERGYPYDMVSYTLRGGHRDNAPPTMRYAYLVREWNARWAYPRLINTTNAPFLQAFEARWGDTLRVLRGDVPGTDYPVAATCTPKETAIDRNTHEWLMAAEKLASLASWAAEYAYPCDTLDKAYRDTFTYDLHCWGLSDVGGPGQDGHWSEKGNAAYRAAALAHDVTIKAANVLADRIAYPDHAHYITVFNTLGQERSDVVRVPLRDWQPCSSPMYWREPGGEEGYPALVSGRAVGRRISFPPAELLEQPFEVIDASTGEHVPYQLSILSDPQAVRRWAPERFALGQIDPRYLHEIVFVAEGLPSMGYKTYRIVPCERWPGCEAGAVCGNPGLWRGFAVENQYYRLEFDSDEGSIGCLYDKELGRDLVDTFGEYGFGQLIVRESQTAEEDALWVTDAAIVESGPLYTTVRFKGEAPCCPRVTIEVTLYHTIKRIDWAARVLRDSTPMRELYVTFPFDVANPRFRFEAPGAVIEPLRDQWPGSNTDYYAVQHWVDVSGADWGVAWTPLDAPMAEFGGLWPGYVSGAHHGVRGPAYGHPFLRPGELNRGHIYSLVSYNNFRTNFINVHAGEFLTRYAFTSHTGAWPEGSAGRFGWGAANPPLAVWMEGPQEGVLPLERSWVQVNAPNVVLLTLKRAEDGDGYIVRLMETQGRETEVTVTLSHFNVRHAFETNLVEENQKLLSGSAHGVRTTITALGILTIRVGASL